MAECESGALYAVASRSESRLADFADEFDVPVCYGSYADLIADPDVQAVHISTPHPFHAQQALALAGGAILDAGICPVSLARLVAGVALDYPYAKPLCVAGIGVLGETGVDEVARAHLLFDFGITAEVSTAITLVMANDAVITGSKGTIRLPDPWVPGRKPRPLMG